jgi:hypothetical protein
MNNPLTPSPSIAIESSSKRAKQFSLLMGFAGFTQFLLYIDFQKSALPVSLIWLVSFFSLAIYIHGLEKKKFFNSPLNILKEKVLFRGVIIHLILLFGAAWFIHYQALACSYECWVPVGEILGLLFAWGLLFGILAVGFVFAKTRYMISAAAMRPRLIITFLIPALTIFWLIFS